jgi:hypothetical protein
MVRALAILALASSACSAPAAAGGAGSAADAGAIPSCGDPPDADADGVTCVQEAKGSVEDLSGVPLQSLVMTFCGSQCYGTQSDDAGAYAIHADGRPDHAVDYLRLTADEPPIITATMRLPTLPPSSVQLPPDGSPASSITVGDLTLVVADGTTFDLDIEDYGTTAGRTLRVASVPLASAPSYATAANVDAIYALAPSGCVPSIPMGVILKNSAALPASAAVDLLVLGDNYFSTPPNVGTLSVQATGHVSADGQTIQTDPGQGIDEITWLAVRKTN